MFIYGTKNIPLANLDLPIACSNCGHEKQEIAIYCTCLSLFYIPFLPYRKKALVYCLNCDKEQNMKTFFKEINSKKETESHFKSILKKTRVPIYLFITTGIAVALIVSGTFGVKHRENLISTQVLSYSSKPFANALLVIKAKEAEAYPYHILYVPEINDQEAIIFVWNYSYEKLSDARQDICKAASSLHGNTVETNFSEPYGFLLKDFSDLDFVYVEQFEKDLDWKKFIPQEKTVRG